MYRKSVVVLEVVGGGLEGKVGVRHLTLFYNYCTITLI